LYSSNPARLRSPYSWLIAFVRSITSGRCQNSGPTRSFIDPRKAAIAIGCNPDTVMKHYVKLDEQEVTDEVMGKLAGCLASKPKKPAE
jgi:hypothetical protein